MKMPLPLTTSTYNSHLSTWLEVLQRAEVCSVLFAPLLGRPNRLQNLEEVLTAQGKKLAILEFPEGVSNNLHEIETTFGDPEVYAIVVMFAERFLQPHFSLLLQSILQKQVATGKGVLFFFDAFWYQLDSCHLRNYINLFQNIDFFPIFSKDDSLQFMTYLGIKWQYVVSEKMAEELWSRTHGQPWLIKEVVRQLVKGVELREVYCSSMYRFKTMELWNVLDPQAQATLKKTLESQMIGADTITQSLLQLGLISTSFPKLIPAFIIEAVESAPKASISIQGEKLLVNQENVTYVFTKLELRFLIALVRNPNHILSREQMAAFCWSDTEEVGYSDWALDQIVKRVRKKLKSLGVLTKSIQTHKGKGYSFNHEAA